ncbi:23S rRNA pseudouridine(1911/1915/1917) synthase RluD [Sansalvadorimonas verongulae]|uniref:23S rRNA pseudouridine(1911/1915/1917) synthase RluD n=1 Tax=Sansalvadorimonas verongulae TaxID=2172824 RepID=UPI0012BD2DB9|nr:23S rRNA pseudouridine(1911/1915/1917) synthase RluD [Sansalvadorimonas verongulae]MTI15229.1 23S rRNA pseudouridine(1911/1915/1917) synthase RluD [Sansalvadorimonas verongulae]
MAEQITLEAFVPEELGGKRLDQIASKVFSDYSRSCLQDWIRSGSLTVDGKTLRPKDKLFGGEQLSLNAEIEDDRRWEPEDIPLDVVYEDDDIIVINKPRNLVVHPAAGNWSGTLLNGLLFRNPELASVPRAGIVHRLDKDTTGLMVVAKTLQAQTDLVEQLQQRTVSREYEAVVFGVMSAGGLVDEPIGRHPTNRLKMSVVVGGKHSVTHYRVLERYRGHTHVRLQLETGRTHQIRVHMSHLRYPLVGDSLYAGPPRFPKGATTELVTALKDFDRQALHARRLGLVHPVSGEYMEWESELPEDFLTLLDVLEQDAQVGME